MRTAICDAYAFYPLRRLVSGPFEDPAELPAIERLLRTIVLHDEIVMELVPLAYDPDADVGLSEQEIQAGGRNVMTAIGPVLTGYDFFTDPYDVDLGREIEPSPALIEVVLQHANAGEGNVYFTAHMNYLKRALGVIQSGGSALLCSEFGQHLITTAQKCPESLFQHLDEHWKCYAKQAEEDGLGLLVPPVLGIVLTRCGRRDAVPVVIRDLRDEWAAARRKAWDLIDALRTARTIGEAVELRQELSEASKLFSPERTEHDSRPVRVLWELFAAATAGAGTATVLGAKPAVGAITGAIAHVQRSVPALLHEFGPALFGRGAFDLARRVRRAVSDVEFDSLPRLLSDAEKQELGFK